MPTINKLLAQSRDLPPLQRKVLGYLESHPDEVYCFGPEGERELAEKVQHPNSNAMAWVLWALHKTALIDREKIGGRYYYGSKKAIATVRARLAKSKT